MEDNVCKFLSTRKPDERINIINFVYERQADHPREFVITSTYTIALVTQGNGALHTPLAEFPLSKGSLFFTFSAKPHYIRNVSQLQYIYISFTGLRALALMQRLSIDYTQPVFSGFDFMIPLWEKTLLDTKQSNADLFCEGLLLYSLGFICNTEDEKDHKDKANGILLVKQYVDLHYTDASVNLQSVSRQFGYQSKYLSAAFKKLVQANFCDYLKDRRLSYALSLIESGITNVKDLAELCGFTDPMYFSKCFKKKYGISAKYFKGKSF